MEALPPPMDVESAHDARREREAAEKHKKELDDIVELCLMGLVFLVLLGAIVYFIFGILAQRQ